MHQIKKKYNEVIALYKLEKNLHDIYVEGNTDRLLIENFFKSKQIRRKVVNIDLVDFLDIDNSMLNGLEIKSNNRNKLIVLSRILKQKLPQTLVRCIIDRDFDDFIKYEDNDKLLRTDYSCFESYFFNTDVIGKFVEIGVGHFPISHEELLSQMEIVLKPLFCFRLLKELKYPKAKMLDLSKNVTVNKEDGSIKFCKEDYLLKFIINNSLVAESEKIQNDFQLLFARMHHDPRFVLHGHDFLDLMFLYFRKVKISFPYKEESFQKVILLTVEGRMLECYDLFKVLLHIQPISSD